MPGVPQVRFPLTRYVDCSLPVKALPCEGEEAGATPVSHPKSTIRCMTYNTEVWEHNKQVQEQVDRMIAKSDEEVFVILHRIAALAITRANKED